MLVRQGSPWFDRLTMGASFGGLTMDLVRQASALVRQASPWFDKLTMGGSAAHHG